MARGGFALAWGCTWIICTNIRPYARLKITSPCRQALWQSERRSNLRAGEGKRVGRKGGRGLVGSAKAGSR